MHKVGLHVVRVRERVKIFVTEVFAMAVCVVMIFRFPKLKRTPQGAERTIVISKYFLCVHFLKQSEVLSNTNVHVHVHVYAYHSGGLAEPAVYPCS